MKKENKEQEIEIRNDTELGEKIAWFVEDAIDLAKLRATIDAEKAEIDRNHAAALTDALRWLQQSEVAIRTYCDVHRDRLFAEKKSMELAGATVGFELMPFHVETASRKIKWKDVIARIVRKGRNWKAKYLRQSEPTVNKDALLTDRNKLTAVQRLALGIQFVQDEQFFIRPQAESAPSTAAVKEAA
jgi:phage host-nuclease inhibitor protein Gam